MSDFSRLNQESSGLEIPAERSFQDREFVFDDLPSWINDIIELLSHLPAGGPAGATLPAYGFPGIFPEPSFNILLFDRESMDPRSKIVQPGRITRHPVPASEKDLS